MNICELAASLKKQSPDLSFFCGNADVDISGMQYYNDQKQFSSDILYIFFEPEQLIQVSHQSGLTSALLLTGDNCHLPDRTIAKLNLFVETKSAQYTIMINQIQELLANDYHMTLHVNDILETVIQNDSIHNVFKKIYQYAGNPIIFIDSSDSVVISEPIDFLKTHRENIPSIDEFSDILFRIQKIGSTKKDPFLFSEDTAHKILACNIVHENYSVGTLFMVEFSSPFTGHSTQEMYFFQEILTHYLATNHTYSFAKKTTFSLLLHNLLIDDRPAPVMIEKLRNSLKYSEENGLRFVVLDFQACPCTQDYDHLISDVLQLFPSVIYTTMDTSVVLLIDNCDNHFEQHILSGLNVLHRNHPIFIGISNCFYHLTNFQKSYHQALTALTYCAKEKDAPDVPYVMFENIAQSELLNFMNEHGNLMDYVSPDILRLLRYDSAHRTQLTHTLSVYLDCFGDAVTTSAKMNLHKNTLYYRLNQIKDILNHELADGDTNYQYMFSLRVLKFLGYL